MNYVDQFSHKPRTIIRHRDELKAKRSKKKRGKKEFFTLPFAVEFKFKQSYIDSIEDPPFIGVGPHRSNWPSFEAAHEHATMLRTDKNVNKDSVITIDKREFAAVTPINF